ncbi:hypothetical protein Vafri_20289 [Volvox africanus]|uniref:Uncharacterized protein n=1 Tax=Volvox africanus TaxID=51714 RepID=A0A8J4FA84_9CHLO|nr:hypothetical protein Vafri_20289 [Volvox africanus]
MDLAPYLVTRRISRRIVKLSSGLKQLLSYSQQRTTAYAGHVASDPLDSIRVAYPNVTRWMQRHNQLQEIAETNNSSRVGTSLFSFGPNRAQEPFTAARTAILCANRSGFFKRECLYAPISPNTTANSNPRDQLVRAAVRRWRPVPDSLLYTEHGVVSTSEVYPQPTGHLKKKTFFRAVLANMDSDYAARAAYRVRTGIKALMKGLGCKFK